MTEKNILIVEDDENVADGLKDILTGYGYGVFAAKDKTGTLEILKNDKIDLLILDIHLGEENGYDLCKKVREMWDIPILFLTGCNSEMELIRGFQVGGDDYVTKPFRMQELIVRIQALLRRTSKQISVEMKSGELIYDLEKHCMKREGNVVELSGTEQKLAAALMSNAPRTMTREELFYCVWDRDASFVEENTLNVNISRLREKLGEFEGSTYIATVRGTGYRWAVPVRR